MQGKVSLLCKKWMAIFSLIRKSKIMSKIEIIMAMNAEEINIFAFFWGDLLIKEDIVVWSEKEDNVRIRTIKELQSEKIDMASKPNLRFIKIFEIKETSLAKDNKIPIEKMIIVFLFFFIFLLLIIENNTHICYSRKANIKISTLYYI